MGEVVQSVYATYPEKNFPGNIARPGEPMSIERGLLRVATGTRNPRPGDALMFDRGENRFRLPTSASEARQVVGILGYDATEIQSGADLDTVSFSDNDEIRVNTFGTFWVTAGEALRWGDRLIWNTANQKWHIRQAPDPGNAAGTTAANIGDSVLAGLQLLTTLPIACVSINEVAADELAEARIGFGRVY